MPKIIAAGVGLPLIGTGATVTTSQPLLNLTQTWNNVATTFTGLKLNVTDTASVDNSFLLDLQKNGSTVFTVNKFGRVIVGDDLQANTAVSVTNNAGLFKLGASSDVVLARDAANTLALRNGTAAQKFNVYNTYTDASNYERASIGWIGNQFRVTLNSAGTGAGRSMFVGTTNSTSVFLGTASTDRWEVNSSGHFLASTDNTYDIGASGANRPRNVYAGSDLIAANKVRGTYFTDPGGTTRFDISGGGVVLIPTGQNLQLGATSSFSWVGQSKVTSPSDGSILFQNNAGTDFTRLILGTNDTSGVAIKKNGTSFSFVLGDDSAFASVDMKDITTSNTTFLHATSASLANGAAAQVATMTNGPTAGNPTKWIAINDNGVTRYIPAW